MCVAIPVEVISIDGQFATVNYNGVQKRVSIALLGDQVSVGDFLIVHAGAAIQRIDPSEARETLELMRQILES